MHIVPEGEPIFSELGYTIEIDDEAGGEYIHFKDGSIRESTDGVKFSPEDWPTLRDGIDRMVKLFNEHQKEKL